MEAAPVNLYVIKEGDELETLVMTLSLIQNILDLKPIAFDKVQEIAEVFGLESKLTDIVEGRVKVKACYYRKPHLAPDELVVVTAALQG